MVQPIPMLSTYIVCAAAMMTSTVTAAIVNKKPFLSQSALGSNALHEIVGLDGVLVLYVEGSNRMTYKQLETVGIKPTLVSAVTVDASQEELTKGGLGVNDTAPFCPHSKGQNRRPVLQAIDASHRKALLIAQKRKEEWTAIFEDDTVPIELDPGFNDKFRNLWAQIPKRIGVVRLSWCPLLSEDDLVVKTYYEYKNFRLVDYQTNLNGKYWTGGCASAYMVRKDYLPRVLRIFPCCSALDACMDSELYHYPKGCHDTHTCWGQKHMMGMDMQDSVNKTMHWQHVTQHGIFAQDNREAASIRHELMIHDNVQNNSEKN
jgi:hypothetical protein